MAEKAAVEPRFHFASKNLKKSEINLIKTMIYDFCCFTEFLMASLNLELFPYTFPYNETKIWVSSPSNSTYGQSQQTHSIASH